MADMFGELDVWLYDKPASNKNTNNPRKKKLKNKNLNTEEIMKIARVNARKFRLKKKAEFQAFLNYSLLLVKTNEKLKKKVLLLKKQLNEMIILCKQKHISC
jgi:hypothetical protein